MSRFWSTCFGGSEDQSNSRRRRGRRGSDSETDSSYDSDDSDLGDGIRKFSLSEMKQTGGGNFRREEDIRLEDVLTEDFTSRNEVGKGRISIVDTSRQGVPPAVTQFVELVLRESQKGLPRNPPTVPRQQPMAPLQNTTTSRSLRMDSILPQVSLLREVGGRLTLPSNGNAEFFASGKHLVAGDDRKRTNSGGSISSSGSSDAESGRSSSTSSGIGDSFASGNDTGGSGGITAGRHPNSTDNRIFHVGDGNRGKTNIPHSTKSTWSRPTLQDVLVEDGNVGYVDQFKGMPKEKTDRQPLATVEGVHLPGQFRGWGPRRLFIPEMVASNPPKFGNDSITRF